MSLIYAIKVLLIPLLSAFILYKLILSHMNNERPIVIFIIGGPGSGKGTQCKLLVKDFGMVHLSIGDILRERRTKDTDEGRQIDEYMKEYEKTGRLMPTGFVLQVMLSKMKEVGWEKNTYLLDGFIKTMDMVRAWDKEMGDKIELKRVINYECPTNVMEERLLNRAKTESRGDDNIDLIKKRFKLYTDQTLQVVEEYKKRGILSTIHSDDAVEEVFVESKIALKLVMGWY